MQSLNECKKPMVSVVIPTYNRARELKRTILSVINQSYSNWEIIVVDNYSEDNTEQIIRQFNHSQIRLIKLPYTGIVAKSRNLGIVHAKGDFVAFLDSDDWWKPTKLECSINELQNGADIVYHNLTKVDSLTLKHIGVIRAGVVIKNVLNEFLFRGNLLPNSSVVVNTAVLQKAGKISEDHELIASEDIDLWIKVAKVTSRFKKIPGSLGYYGCGVTNISANRDFSIAATKLLNSYSEILSNNELQMANGYISYVKGTYLQYQKEYKNSIAMLLNSLLTAHYTIKLKSLYRIANTTILVLKNTIGYR